MQLHSFCLDVCGDYACFSRPEMHVERVSYPVMTPSAGRAVYEAILWKPGLRWRLRRIEVLKPVKWISVRRNEVGAVASTRNAIGAMNEGRGALALYVEDERQQRAGLFLRDVAYRLHAELEFVSDEARANPRKYVEMFERRAARGQCINQPYLGCREFDARFRPVELVPDDDGRPRVADGEPPPHDWTEDLGWMFHDFDFRNPADPQPRFFQARMNKGVLDLDDVELRT